MSKLSLPSPHEPFVDVRTGKISDIWYRYVSATNVAVSSLDKASARAWGMILTSGTTTTLSDSYNVSAISSVSTVGAITVNLTNGFATTVYSVVPSVIGTTGQTVVVSTGQTSTSFVLQANSTAFAAGYSFVCYGDQ